MYNVSFELIWRNFVSSERDVNSKKLETCLHNHLSPTKFMGIVSRPCTMVELVWTHTPTSAPWNLNPLKLNEELQCIALDLLLVFTLARASNLHQILQTLMRKKKKLLEFNFL